MYINDFDVVKQDDRTYQIRTKYNVLHLDFDSDIEREVFELLIRELKAEGFSWKQFLDTLEADSRAYAIDIRQTLEEELILLYEKDVLCDGMQLHKQDEPLAFSACCNVTLCIIGASLLLDTLVKAAEAIPFKQVLRLKIDSSIQQEELEDIIKQADFIMFESHLWSPYHLSIVNELCIKYDLPWLYLDGLKGELGQLGPIFWGNKLGCYNCLKQRMLANMLDADAQKKYEDYLKKEHVFSKPDNYFAESIRLQILSHMAILEVVKFWEQFAIPATWRTIIQMNMLDFSVKKSHMLKVPFCPTCNSKVEYNPAPWLEEVSL